MLEIKNKPRIEIEDALTLLEKNLNINFTLSTTEDTKRLYCSHGYIDFTNKDVISIEDNPEQQEWCIQVIETFLNYQKEAVFAEQKQILPSYFDFDGSGYYYVGEVGKNKSKVTIRFKNVEYEVNNESTTKEFGGVASATRFGRQIAEEMRRREQEKTYLTMNNFLRYTGDKK